MREPTQETLEAPRSVARETVSSGDRGRSLVDLIDRFEAEQPRLDSTRSLSSSSLRAGLLIRRMRDGAGFSQAQLAERLGVTQARVSELERGLGKQGPTWDVMERVAQACGCDWLESLYRPAVPSAASRTG